MESNEKRESSELEPYGRPTIMMTEGGLVSNPSATSLNMDTSNEQSATSD
jgi:hypothetical protein